MLLAIVSLAAAIAVQSAAQDARREREIQLLFAGDQIRAAIVSYHARAPKGMPFTYPEHLEDLLMDRRFPVPVHHLRRLYVDPMTGRSDWVLDTLQGRIVGVHSSASGVPLRNANFSAADSTFAGARDYEQWKFAAAAADNGPPATTQFTEAGIDTSMAPADPAQPPPQTDPSFAQRAQCDQAYMVPEQSCNDEPPPYGKNSDQCIQHFDQLFQACLNATPSLP